jgi:hypothetical protein
VAGGSTLRTNESVASIAISPGEVGRSRQEVAAARENAMAISMQLAQPGVLAETFRALKKGLLDPYRPELHYMRGPGPKWREKHEVGLQPRTSTRPLTIRSLAALAG